MIHHDIPKFYGNATSDLGCVFWEWNHTVGNEIRNVDDLVYFADSSELLLKFARIANNVVNSPYKLPNSALNESK